MDDHPQYLAIVWIAGPVEIVSGFDRRAAVGVAVYDGVGGVGSGRDGGAGDVLLGMAGLCRTGAGSGWWRSCPGVAGCSGCGCGGGRGDRVFAFVMAGAV